MNIIFFFLILLNPHRRKAVTDAATSKWPGNNIPVFNKDNKAKKELEALVEKLSPDCTFEPAGFNVESIKQHILDVLNDIVAGTTITMLVGFFFKILITHYRDM